jgi:transposase
MDSSWMAVRHRCAKLSLRAQLKPFQKESVMHSTTVAVDLAKNVFELAVANAESKIGERLRLNRTRFAAFFVHRPPCRVLMEACGSAHYWARCIARHGHTVELLPAQYVRAYVRRNKTDRADAAALIEAVRSGEIRTVPVKSVEQQQLLALHRLRAQWMSTRHRYINTLRGLLREFGIAIPLGARVARAQIASHLARPPQELPAALLPLLAEMLSEVDQLERRTQQVERELAALTRSHEVVQRLRQVPGIGLLTSTALHATVGDIQRFPCGRRFASWLGLTPREYSSGERRRLGSISKQGDVYLRTLLVHGARSALLAAHRQQRTGRPLDRLRQWALQCERLRGHNVATVALANRLARIVWATWKHQRPFDGNWGRSTH